MIARQRHETDEEQHRTAPDEYDPGSVDLHVLWRQEAERRGAEQAPRQHAQNRYPFSHPYSVADQAGMREMSTSLERIGW